MHFSARGFTPDWLAALHVFESALLQFIRVSSDSSIKRLLTFPGFLYLLGMVSTHPTMESFI